MLCRESPSLLLVVLVVQAETHNGRIIIMLIQVRYASRKSKNCRGVCVNSLGQVSSSEFLLYTLYFSLLARKVKDYQSISSQKGFSHNFKK